MKLKKMSLYSFPQRKSLYLYVFFSHSIVFLRFWGCKLFLEIIRWLEFHLNIRRLYLVIEAKWAKMEREKTVSFDLKNQSIKYIYKLKTQPVYIEICFLKILIFFFIMSLYRLNWVENSSQNLSILSIFRIFIISQVLWILGYSWEI